MCDMNRQENSALPAIIDAWLKLGSCWRSTSCDNSPFIYVGSFPIIDRVTKLRWDLPLYPPPLPFLYCLLPPPRTVVLMVAMSIIGGNIYS